MTGEDRIRDIDEEVAMRRLTVSDVMTTEVITAREATPFKELARIMAERRVSALPVLGVADELVGVVSEADLLPKEEHRDDRPGRWALRFGGEHLSRVKAAGDTAVQLTTPTWWSPIPTPPWWRRPEK